MESPALRVDTATTPEASDTHDPDNDPQRLLKLSHSLRYQLSQPLKRQTVQDAAAQPGVASSQQGLAGMQQPYQHPYGRQPTSLRIVPLHTHPPPPQHYPPQQLGPDGQPYYPGQPGQAGFPPAQPLPPLKGPGTKSGPYTGYASKAWLQAEVRQDVDDLRRHVDEYASKREHRAFDLERSALKAEIANLRQGLQETEGKVAKLEMMMPDEDGEFKALKAELVELEKEADYFSDLYVTQSRATQAALDGFRQALADIDEIENEFDHIRYLLAQMEQQEQQQYQQYQQLQQAQQFAPPEPVVVASPRGCCGCFRRKQR